MKWQTCRAAIVVLSTEFRTSPRLHVKLTWNDGSLDKTKRPCHKPQRFCTVCVCHRYALEIRMLWLQKLNTTVEVTIEQIRIFVEWENEVNASRSHPFISHVVLLWQTHQTPNQVYQSRVCISGSRLPSHTIQQAGLAWANFSLQDITCLGPESHPVPRNLQAASGLFQKYSYKNCQK